jgi:hypothetical protein
MLVEAGSLPNHIYSLRVHNPSDFKLLAERPVRAAQRQIHEVLLIENGGAVRANSHGEGPVNYARLQPQVEGWSFDN